MTYTERELVQTIRAAVIRCDGPGCGRDCTGASAFAEGWWVVEQAAHDTLHFCSRACLLRWFSTQSEAAGAAGATR